MFVCRGQFKFSFVKKKIQFCARIKSRTQSSRSLLTQLNKLIHFRQDPNKNMVINLFI